MNLLRTSEAAEQKNVTRQAIISAVDRGAIDGKRLGPRFLAVLDNRKFREWEPDRVKQANRAGRESQKPKKRAARKRKG